jgi:hypothetical protein
MVCTECDAYIDEKTKEAHDRNKNTLFGAIGVASGAGLAALLSGILTTLQLLDIMPILPGPRGADGLPGIDGTDGTDGQDGKNGTNGANGQDGQNGADNTNDVQNITINGHTLTVTYANEVKTYFVPAMSRRFQQAVAEEYLDGRHTLRYVGVRPSTVF